MTADLPAVSNAKLRLVLDGLGSTGSVANLNWMEFVIPSAKDEVPVSPYVKQIEYSGATFFDGFDFFTAPDVCILLSFLPITFASLLITSLFVQPTHGYVRYVDRNTATNEWLARVTPSGQVMMTVDNSSIASSPGRKSVRIHSKQRFNGGLFILDLEHMPYVLQVFIYCCCYYRCVLLSHLFISFPFPRVAHLLLQHRLWHVACVVDQRT